MKMLELLAIASVGLGLGFTISSILNFFSKLIFKKFLKEDLGLIVAFIIFVGSYFMIKALAISLVFSITWGIGFVIPIFLFSPQKNE